jgi:hypothetical protein
MTGSAALCGARTRRGTACRCRGVGRGGRCKFHGGLSTGPRTAAGKARIAAAQRARWEHWRATKSERLLARLCGLLGIDELTQIGIRSLVPDEPAPEPSSTIGQVVGRAGGQPVQADVWGAKSRYRPIFHASAPQNRYARGHRRKHRR